MVRVSLVRSQRHVPPPPVASGEGFLGRWGEPVWAFVSCILQHAKERYYTSADDESFLDVPYWICAYANNQVAPHFCFCVCVWHVHLGMCMCCWLCANNSPYLCMRTPPNTHGTTRAKSTHARMQHELGGDVTADPSQSSFRKAMALARDNGGGTVSVVDNQATASKRIWCAALHSQLGGY